MNVALLVALAVLQVLDGWTTRHILSHGGRELNTLMAWLMDEIGVVPALTVKGLGVVGIGWYLMPIPWALGILVAAYAGVVLFNFRSV